MKKRLIVLSSCILIIIMIIDACSILKESRCGLYNIYNYNDYCISGTDFILLKQEYDESWLPFLPLDIDDGNYIILNKRDSSYFEYCNLLLRGQNYVGKWSQKGDSLILSPNYVYRHGYYYWGNLKWAYERDRVLIRDNKYYVDITDYVTREYEDLKGLGLSEEQIKHSTTNFPTPCKYLICEVSVTISH